MNCTPHPALGGPPPTVPVALTIAGSDSGGGAGIQADLKTFSALGVFGTSAITCITAQNPDAVAAVAPVDPCMVAEQVRTVCSGFPVAAAKTGMLYSVQIIRAVAEVLRQVALPFVCVDPVMVATSGARLLKEDAVDALKGDVLALGQVVTPNLPEAEILSGLKIRSVDDMRSAAVEIGRAYGTACVVKGGHMGTQDYGTRITVRSDAGNNRSETNTVVDVLYADGELIEARCPRVDACETHGTGCTFSAALTACVAMGDPLPVAFRKAQQFVVRALTHAVQTGRHSPLGVGCRGAVAPAIPSRSR